MKYIEKIRLSLAFHIMPKRFREGAAVGVIWGRLESLIETALAHVDECPDCRGGDDA